MVGEAERSNDRAQLGELLEKRVWLRDRGDCGEVCSTQRVERKSLTGCSASQLARREVRDSDRHARSDVRKRATHVRHRGSVGRLSCDDHERRSARRSKWLAPRAGWKQSWLPQPRVRVHQQNIGIPAGATVLKGVVQDYYIRTSGNCPTNPAHSIGKCDDGDSFVQSLVHDDLVPTVTAQHDRRSRALLGKPVGEPRGNGSLAGAAYRQMPDA
jgi:hypothetical protein